MSLVELDLHLIWFPGLVGHDPNDSVVLLPLHFSVLVAVPVIVAVRAGVILLLLLEILVARIIVEIFGRDWLCIRTV